MNVRISDSTWFVPMAEDRDEPGVHVLGLPQAGGGCATLGGLAARLQPGATLWGANLPGRQARFSEPPRRELAPLVDDLLSALTPHTRRPYLLFGYCSGALLAFLLARSVRAADLPLPKALVVASYPAPQLAKPARHLHTLPSEEFWEEIVSNGGFPSRLAAQPDFREIFEDVLRADYEMIACYEHRDEPPLPIPVVAIAGRQDPVLSAGEAAAWAEQTTGHCAVHLVQGDHWLLDSALDDVAAAVRQECV